VGPVKGKFKGKLTLSDLVPAEGYHFRIEGRGPAGFVNGEGDLQLVDDDGGTLLRYQVDAKVGGRIAGVGQRLLDSSAKVVTRQGFEGFERQLVARQQAEDGAAAQVAAPSQAAFAARVAGGVVAELVPPRWRPWLAAAGVLVLAVVGIVLVRSCF
jgi:hypothetical protein